MSTQDGIVMFGPSAIPKVGNTKVKHSQIRNLVYLPQIIWLSFVLDIIGIGRNGKYLIVLSVQRPLRLQVTGPGSCSQRVHSGSGDAAKVILDVIVGDRKSTRLNSSHR